MFDNQHTMLGALFGEPVWNAYASQGGGGVYQGRWDVGIVVQFAENQAFEARLELLPHRTGDGGEGGAVGYAWTVHCEKEAVDEWSIEEVRRKSGTNGLYFG